MKFGSPPWHQISHANLYLLFSNAKADVMNNFCYVVELLDVATEGMVCLLALKLLGVDTLNAKPEVVPPLAELSKAIVSEIWEKPGGGEIIDVLTAPDVDDYGDDSADKICICGNGNDLFRKNYSSLMIYFANITPFI
jgi:hypothetical protein